VVLKVYPLMSWVWVGMGLALSGMIVLLIPKLWRSESGRRPTEKGIVPETRQAPAGCPPSFPVSQASPRV